MDFELAGGSSAPSRTYRVSQGKPLHIAHGPCRAVLAYAWSLLATHAVVWLFFTETNILKGLTDSAEPYCWPYFENCWRWRLPQSGTILLQIAYLALGLLAGAALWQRRWRTFRWVLLVLNLFLFGIVSLDYRLRANEFYMLFWVHGIFLSSSAFRWTIPLAIISCYFWAGTLKLNHEWLSGAVLYRDLWFTPREWTPVACAYVVALETLGIWGLLARRRWILIATLTQLALFHVESLSQIHWFYPLLMSALLSWFVLDRWLAVEDGRANLRALFRGQAPCSVYALLMIFGVLQIAPSLFRGDSVLTGQGRLVALHMFEARQVCEVIARPSAGVSTAPIDLKVRSLPPRMVCDPVVYFNRAQNMCRERRRLEPTFDMHLIMRAKRTTDPEFKTIIDESNYCSAEHRYQIFKNNAWLHYPSRR